MKLFFYIIISLSFIACNNSIKSDKQNKNDSTQTLNPKPETLAIKPENAGINYLADCKNYYTEAKKLDSILLKEIDVNPDLANKAIKAFTNFAYYCHSDSMSPVYLIKTAQVARSINNTPQAKIVLDKCIADYPNFKNRPAALFLLAQVYDEPGALNSETEAQKIYQKIIDEYPKSDWAKSAKGALTFIGKSDAQIMEELKKKKK
ncbi:MAG: tetratricopeptide repeat protein [Bacteroidota bacterium]|nr:tetratricopeptide repeat protein [Bacteroidota bacterium]